jgi:glycosyltransferase involved in cell wall biosynthesis
MLTVKTLLADGWAVTVVAEDARPSDVGRMHKLQQLGAEVWAGPTSRGARHEYLDFTHAQELLRASEYDIAIVHFWGIAERWMPLVRACSPETKVVVESVDLHFLRTLRGRFLGLDGTSSHRLGGELWKPIFGELNAYADADAVFTVSTRERELVDLLIGRPRTAYHVPLGSPIPENDPPGAAGRVGLLYVGGFDHPPNRQAARTLVEDILPQLEPGIRAAHPLRIVGSALTSQLAEQWSSNTDVVAVGWVPSLLTEFNHSRVFAAPLPNGAGVKTKILSALAAGLPVVTNRFGMEGLDELVPGRELLSVDHPKDFAESVEWLLTDDDLWTRISRAGRAWAEVHAGPDPAARSLRAAIDSILSNAR